MDRFSGGRSAHQAVFARLLHIEVRSILHISEAMRVPQFFKFRIQELKEMCADSNFIVIIEVQAIGGEASTAE